MHRVIWEAKTTQLIVGIAGQGSMGAATAARLVECGIQVRTVVAGRSMASIDRAQKAGMTAVSWDEFVEADFILSIVPPAEAVPTAKQLAPVLERAHRKPVYVDLNAVNPVTAMIVNDIVNASQCIFVDGAIIGLPPRAGSEGPRYYVSGPEASEIRILAPFGLDIRVLDGPIGAASALKMSYAGISKGLIALGSAMILAADRAGISDALFAELSASQPDVLAGLSRSIPDMSAKAKRWVAEMEEIAGFVGDGTSESEIYHAIGAFYARLGAAGESGSGETDTLKAFFEAAKIR